MTLRSYPIQVANARLGDDVEARLMLSTAKCSNYFSDMQKHRMGEHKNNEDQALVAIIEGLGILGTKFAGINTIL